MVGPCEIMRRARLLAAADDVFVRSFLLVPRLEAERRFAPRRHRRLAADRRLALAAAVRVVHRVHDGTADRRASAEPAAAAGLADLDQLVVFVADGTDGGAARAENAAHFARRQAHDHVAAFLAEQLGFRAGRPDELAAFARLQLDVVDDGADGDVFQRQRVADLDVGLRPGFDHIAHLETLRRDDVALLAVDVVDERDVRRPVRVVFDRGNFAGNAVLVALEIDDAVFAFMPAALVAGRDFALVVAARFSVQR